MPRKKKQKKKIKQCLDCGKEFRAPEWKKICTNCYRKEQKEKEQFENSLKNFRFNQEEDSYKKMKRMAKKLYGTEPKY